MQKTCKYLSALAVTLLLQSNSAWSAIITYEYQAAVSSFQLTMFYDTPKTSFHPGLYLQELLIWHNISPEKLADTMGMPETEIVDITEKRRGIDKTISEGLAAYFGNSSQFWLDLQEHFDHRD